MDGRGRQLENVASLKTRGSSSSVPFKDRTNSQNTGQQGERKTGSKGNSLSELTPPLNAARLRPISQSTRTATVSHLNVSTLVSD